MSGGAAATTPWRFHAAFWRCRAASKATGEIIPIAECRRVVLYSSIQAATLARAAARVGKSSRERSSNSRVECQASMAALSSAEPGRPIDWEMPSRVQAARTRPAVYSLPWSVLSRLRLNSDYAEVSVKPRNCGLALSGRGLLTGSSA